MCVLINYRHGCLTCCLCADVCVKGPGLVLCNSSVKFLGERNRCDRFFVLTVMVCERLDNPLEQVLTGTPSHFQHGQVWNGVEGCAGCVNGFLGWWCHLVYDQLE
jgi:hypothetical protein